MESTLSKCGYRCDLCLAFKPNIEAHPENKQILSDGCYQYFGFRIPPEQISCDGCLSINGKLIDRDCPVRPCAMERGLENCAHCTDYICDKLQSRLVDFDELQSKFNKSIPPLDRDRFINPYVNIKRLRELRIN